MNININDLREGQLIKDGCGSMGIISSITKKKSIIVMWIAGMMCKACYPSVHRTYEWDALHDGDSMLDSMVLAVRVKHQQ